MLNLLNSSWSLTVDIFSVFCSVFTILSFSVAYITWYNLSWDKGWEKKLIKIQWYDTVVGYYKDVPLIINIDFKFINIKETFELSYPKYWKKAILKGHREISTWIKKMFTEDKLWKTFLEVSESQYNYFYNIAVNVEWNDKKEEFIISIYSQDVLKIVLRKDYNYKSVKKNKSPTDNKSYFFTKLIDNKIMSKKHRCREKMINYSPWVVDQASQKQIMFFNEKNEKIFNKYMYYANKLSSKKHIYFPAFLYPVLILIGLLLMLTVSIWVSCISKDATTLAVLWAGVGLFIASFIGIYAYQRLQEVGWYVHLRAAIENASDDSKQHNIDKRKADEMAAAQIMIDKESSAADDNEF